MALVSTAEIVTDAAAQGRGVGAFNVITLEHAEGIIGGAERAGLPAVLQISQNAVKFHNGQVRPVAAACREAAAASSVPVALHLDHVEDRDLLYAAADAGFSSVMYDGSRLPYDENIAATCDAAEWAHERGLWLEAELGEVGGKEGAHAPGVRTDPKEARDFVDRTGVDALAVAVGSSHAMTSRDARLDHDLIARLREAVPVPLVLHGSSGVPNDELARAVSGGMVKVNIGTALNIAFTEQVRGFLEEDAKVVDPRRYLVLARDALADVVAHLLSVLAGG